ncbi:MAG: SDR family oxidoreductase [Burkholderiales bacterium]|nr:SDR family oxidoreductase [Burkholderiales bacterium]
MTPLKILIIGATSAIAEATARRWAAQGHALCLLGRHAQRLQTLADDLKVRGAAAAHCAVLDVNDFAAHAGVLEAATSALQGLDLVLIAHGTLGDQKACERDVAATLQELNTNALSVIALLTLLANRFEAQRSGSIAVIGSVAGDRGRQSNYVYGTAKGALGLFLQGLRNRLQPAGVQVLTIKPGFVDTPMTAAFDKKGPLWATPDAVARDIVSAIERRRDVLYTPWFWRGIMMIIRLIPERVFKRLRL